MKDLSDRETRTLVLTARGLSGREIAAEMQVSESTVRQFQKNIRNKYGVGSMVEAVGIGLVMGAFPKGLPVKAAVRMRMGLPPIPGEESGWSRVSIREAIEIERRKRALR